MVHRFMFNLKLHFKGQPARKVKFSLGKTVAIITFILQLILNWTARLMPYGLVNNVVDVGNAVGDGF